MDEEKIEDKKLARESQEVVQQEKRVVSCMQQRKFPLKEVVESLAHQIQKKTLTLFQ